MRIIVVLWLAGLAGCATTPSSYYGEYTHGGEAADYMAALKSCRVAAEKKADKDNYGESWTAVWLSYVDKYTLACMNEKGFELVKWKTNFQDRPALGGLANDL
jgi:hypothetical protein